MPEETALEGLSRWADEAATGSLPKQADFAAAMLELSDLFLILLDEVTAHQTGPTDAVIAQMNLRWLVPTTRRIRGITQGSANGGGG